MTHRAAVLVVAQMLAAVLASGQPESDTRREMLEARRDVLASRLAEIEAELSGEVPPGTVSLFAMRDSAQNGRPGQALPERPGRREGQGRDWRSDAPWAIEPQARDQILAELEATDPDFAARVREEADRREGGRLPVFRRLRGMSELRERDPEAFAARREEILAGLRILRAAREVRRAVQNGTDTGEADEITNRLRTAVAGGFDAKRAVLQLEINRGKQRTAVLQQRFDRAEAERETLIDEHTERLLDRIRSSPHAESTSGK